MLIISSATSTITNLIQLRFNIANANAAQQNLAYSNQLMMYASQMAATNFALQQQAAAITAASNSAIYFGAQQYLRTLTNSAVTNH